MNSESRNGEFDDAKWLVGTLYGSLLPRAEAQPDVTISAWTRESVGGCQKPKAPDATFPNADLAQAPREAQAWLMVCDGFLEELQ